MKRKRSIVINVFIVCITSWIIVEIMLNDYSEKEIKEESMYNMQSLGILVEENTISSNSISEENNVVIEKEEIFEEQQELIEEKVIEDYKGYKVIAKLQIPNIALETYVLEEYSNKALNISVTKFWGSNPNEIGNLCIAGHNFQNKNMFHNIRRLKKGDNIFLTDNKTGKLQYTVYDIYKVFPEDVSCLSQETNGKKEITLITCTNDSKKRIIIKARESIS